MTLGLNIAKIAGPGRPSRPLSAEVIRELVPADVAMLAATPRGMTAPPIQRITDRHQSLARLLARGVPDGEAAMVVGYDISRVSILKQSPAFAELLDFYRRETAEEHSTTVQHMAGLGRDAILELRQRIEDDPEKFSNRELLNMVTDLVDRSRDDEGSGAGPTRIELVPFVGDSDEGDGKSSSSEIAAE